MAQERFARLAQLTRRMLALRDDPAKSLSSRGLGLLRFGADRFSEDREQATGMGWDGVRWDRMGRGGVGGNEMGGDGVERNGMGWGELGRDGVSCEGME